MWIGSITIDQVISLIPVFAKLTDQGWIVPQWLLELETAVILRDKKDVLTTLTT